jgi:hypothetical protein
MSTVESFPAFPCLRVGKYDNASGFPHHPIYDNLLNPIDIIFHLFSDFNRFGAVFPTRILTRLEPIFVNLLIGSSHILNALP